MKIKTSELSGIALDWAVAKCEGIRITNYYHINHGSVLKHEQKKQARDAYVAVEYVNSGWILGKYSYWEDGVVILNNHYSPSSNWSQGGPIIERDKLNIILENDGEWSARTQHGTADNYFTFKIHFGQTPLIAAMRCYVASKLGDEVEVPDELLEEVK